MSELFVRENRPDSSPSRQRPCISWHTESQSACSHRNRRRHAEAGSLIFLTRSFPLKSNCTSQSKLLVRSGRLRGMQVDVGDFLQLTYLYDVSSEDLGELITH